MAWRSSGTTNEEMVDKLCHYHIITSPFVESSFRAVDRLLFVPPVSQKQDIQCNRTLSLRVCVFHDTHESTKSVVVCDV